MIQHPKRHWPLTACRPSEAGHEPWNASAAGARIGAGISNSFRRFVAARTQGHLLVASALATQPRSVRQAASEHGQSITPPPSGE